MSGDITWDTSGLNELVADLGRGELRTVPLAAAVVAKGALNVKNEARQMASGLRHAPAYPASITYDIAGNGLSAEIGPDKDKRQGALGNILEYGTSKNAPHAHLGPALDREGPAFEKALGDIVDGLL